MVKLLVSDEWVNRLIQKNKQNSAANISKKKNVHLMMDTNTKKIHN